MILRVVTHPANVDVLDLLARSLRDMVGFMDGFIREWIDFTGMRDWGLRKVEEYLTNQDGVP